jgi:hypothetical protein
MPTIQNVIGQTGRLYEGDSHDFEVVGMDQAAQVLSDWGGAPSMQYEQIQLYRTDIFIAGSLEPTGVVVDGSADVDGRVSVDDPCGLFVRGQLKCQSFWAHDAETRIGELDVAVAGFLALSGGGLHDIGPIRAPVFFMDTPSFEFHVDSAIDHLVLLDDEDRALLKDDFSEASLHEVFNAYVEYREPFRELPERRVVPRRSSSTPFLQWVLDYEGELGSVQSLARALNATKRRRDDFPAGTCSPDELVAYLVSLKAPDARFKVLQAKAAWSKDEPA